jgi:hypothetical protein
MSDTERHKELLLSAARDGDVSAVCNLLADGADVNKGYLDLSLPSLQG